MSWSEAMVDRLAALKLIPGMEHETAWVIALAENAPRGSEFRGALTLLPPKGEVDPVEFLRRASEDAWYGRRPGLAALTVDAVDRALPASSRVVAAPLSGNVG